MCPLFHLALSGDLTQAGSGMTYYNFIADEIGSERLKNFPKEAQLRYVLVSTLQLHLCMWNSVLKGTWHSAQLWTKSSAPAWVLIIT